MKISYFEFLWRLLLTPKSLLATLISVFWEVFLSTGFIVASVVYASGTHDPVAVSIILFVMISIVIWFFFSFKIYHRIRKQGRGLDWFFEMSFSESLRYLNDK